MTGYTFKSISFLPVFSRGRKMGGGLWRSNIKKEDAP